MDLLNLQHMLQKLEAENDMLEISIVQELQRSIDPSDVKLLNELQRTPTQLWPERLSHCYPSFISGSKRRLEQLQAAISQLKLGIYGVCADCEAEIEASILQQDPAAQRCLRCEKKLRTNSSEFFT